MSDSRLWEFPALPVPNWLTDETFYSLCCRYHQIAGHRLASTTSEFLFGHSRCGSSHDFPGRIVEFCRRTDHFLGDPRSLMLGRTLLPYYLPFRTQDQADIAVKMLAGVLPGNLKFQLGLLTSGFRANHPLKACLLCLEEDIANYGIGIGINHTSSQE